jgi:fructose-1,6-bisphosphatase/inositol monophosphatase family enzyme
MLPDALKTLSELVSRLADQELLPRFNCRHADRKADGSLITEADIVMQAALIKALEKHWPGIGVLGEEMSVEEQQAALDQADSSIWCIDPLDGTSNFSVGVPYYAVSVALLKGNQVEMGVVYDPSRKECFAAARGQGAWLNNKPLRPRKLATPLSQGVALIDLKRLPADLARRHGNERWKDVLKHTAHLMTELGADPVLTHDRVAGLDAKVRYLIGDRDEMVSLEETIGFYRATPEATLGVLPNTRHPIEKVDLNVLLPHLIAHLASA